MSELTAAVTALFMMATMPAAAAAAGSEPSGNLLPEPLLAQAATLRDEALQSDGALETVKSLTVEVGPRLAGSAGDRAAVAWALTRLREMGFANVRTQPVEVPRWERGDITVRITEPFPQRLEAVALGGSIGTSDEGLTLPVLAVDSLAALRALDADVVAGNAIYLGQRMVRSQDGSGYSEAVKKRSEGAIEAARLGARALLIRSAGTSRARLAHTGGMKTEAGVPRIPAVALSNPDADMLETQLASARPVSVYLRLTARDLAPALSANVIAEVPGSGESDEIVLLAAHLDSWDLGTGAIDDAAGVAIITEAARLIAQLPAKPRRTLRILLAANEEFGLSGAEAYAADQADRLDQHVIGLEADLGADAVYALESRVLEQDLPIVEAMQAVLAPLGVARGGNDAGGGADLSPMRKLGMPVLAPRQDARRYFDYHHTADDTLDKIDEEALRQNVAVYAALALIAAEMPARFSTRPAETETP